MKQFFLILLLLCVGCTDNSIATANKAIERELIDPGSVQYRNVKAYPGGRVCGELNSKNRMGGYVGFKNFIYSQADSIVNIDATVTDTLSICNNESEDKFWLEHNEKMCKSVSGSPWCEIAEKRRLRLDKRSKTL